MRHPFFAFVLVLGIASPAAAQQPVVVDQARLARELQTTLQALSVLETVASAYAKGACGQLAPGLKQAQQRLQGVLHMVRMAPAPPAPCSAPSEPPTDPGAPAVAPPAKAEPPAASPQQPMYPDPMAPQDYQRLVTTLQAESFPKGRMRVLGQAAPHAWFTAQQAAGLLGLFTFGADRLTALRLLAPRILDRQNAYVIYSAFTFDAEKQQAQQLLMPPRR